MFIVPLPEPVDDTKAGGAPGPIADRGSKSLPLYTRGLSVPMVALEKQMCSLLSIVALLAYDPGIIPVRAKLRMLGLLVTFSSQIIPAASNASV